MTRYAIALGSNLGDRVGHLRAAVDEIGGLGAFWTVSGLYETSPVGGPEQDPYLNAVVMIDSHLSPQGMLEQLQGIESGHGRERAVRWGPRTLDLDIVASDQGTVHTPELQIPHPRAAERLFVLEPLCDVWPEALVGDGLTAVEARERAAEQSVDLLVSTWVIEDPRPGRYWVGAQLIVFLGIIVALVYDGSLPGSDWRVLRVVGASILVAGLVALFATARSLGPALTALPEPVRGAALVETGLYAYVRHPMYGAVVFTMVGTSLLLASWAASVLSIGLIAFFWAKSSYEERQLRIAYPGYTGYRNRVRRRMIPLLL